jgi:hypothetical protein
MDVLEPADRRPVESDAFGEETFGELFDGYGEVLPCPRQIDEAKVDDLDLLLFGEPEDVLGLDLRCRWRRGRGPSLDG